MWSTGDDHASTLPATIPDGVSMSAAEASQQLWTGSKNPSGLRDFRRQTCVQHRNTDSRFGSCGPAALRRRYAKCLRPLSYGVRYLLCDRRREMLIRGHAIASRAIVRAA
jgi:hypothetical protein